MLISILSRPRGSKIMLPKKKVYVSGTLWMAKALHLSIPPGTLSSTEAKYNSLTIVPLSPDPLHRHSIQYLLDQLRSCISIHIVFPSVVSMINIDLIHLTHITDHQTASPSALSWIYLPDHLFTVRDSFDYHTPDQARKCCIKARGCHLCSRERNH